MPHFYPLTVTNIEKTIRDAVVVTLQPPDGVEFAFTQGQYLTFRRLFEDQELRRSYSICAGRDDGVLQVGIKRVDGGTFSTWANTELSIGDTMEAMLPMGNFYSPTQQNSPHYLALAAGSGITPILSILRTALATEPTARVTLVYANRNPNTIMFREELADLKDQHMGALDIIHVLDENTQDIDLFKGPLDLQKCKALFTHWVNVDSIAKAFICGPEPMMTVVVASLEEQGMCKDAIRFELFASSQPGRAKAPAKSVAISAQGVAGRVTFDGETRSLLITANSSLLETALENNIDAPHACKAGVCSTCKAKVLEGEVEMVANHALEDYEVEAGYVLTCQCFPVSSEQVVWDYDQAGH